MLTKIKKYIVFLLILTTIFSLHVVNAAEQNPVKNEAEFANFRNVRAGKIGRNILYRSQHPANGSKRSIYANKLAQENGIRYVLNLSDSKSQLKKYFKNNQISPSYYYRTLYNKNRIYTAHMSGRHTSSSYRKKVARSLRFMSKHNGPFLVHCQVGRDRTGFVILLLECLMEASYKDMLNDYAQSYVNINGYSLAQSQSKAVQCLNEEFQYMTGKKNVTDWTKVDLVKYAERYLKKGGMTSREIKKLKKRLSVSRSSR